MGNILKKFICDTIIVNCKPRRLGIKRPPVAYSNRPDISADALCILSIIN